jgi:hypothetical protein
MQSACHRSQSGQIMARPQNFDSGDGWSLLCPSAVSYSTGTPKAWECATSYTPSKRRVALRGIADEMTVYEIP